MALGFGGKKKGKGAPIGNKNAAGKRTGSKLKSLGKTAAYGAAAGTAGLYAYSKAIDGAVAVGDTLADSTGARGIDGVKRSMDKVNSAVSAIAAPFNSLERGLRSLEKQGLIGIREADSLDSRNGLASSKNNRY